MLNSFPAALLVGTALGFLSGLGVGGGSLLILWLTLVLGMDQETARGINLLFFLPAAATASISRRKQGGISLSVILPAALAGAAAAGICSIFHHSADADPIKKAFGCLLMVIGIREIRRK